MSVSILRHPLVAVAIGLLALPQALLAMGLTLTSATDCVIFAMVGIALNLLLGYTGLASFGHGAWFGVGAYAIGILQRDLFPDSFVLPLLGAVLIVFVASLAFGALILRRKGVYFSLLTLALTALLFTIAYRWTELTGGESGLGNIVRPVVIGVDLASAWNYYALVATIGFLAAFGLWRVVRSPFGHVLVAIRENETRARFQGYPTDRYKLAAFVVSATITGLAGGLSGFHHRIASADPLLVSFSGELLAMVVIGGSRSFLGPMLGALFYILFREFLTIWTPHWLFFFGLLFCAFILFSPRGLIGLAARIKAMIVPAPVTGSAMAGGIMASEPRALPAFLVSAASIESGAVLICEGIDKRFGGIVAVTGARIAVGGRGIHALIGPNGAGKTTFFNVVSGMFAPDKGTIRYRGGEIGGLAAEAVASRGLARSFQITNLFPALSVRENLRLGIQARDPLRFAMWPDAATLATVERETDALLHFLGLEAMAEAPAESLSYGGQRLVDLGIALAARPGLLLLDEPLAGLAVAQRARVADLVRRLSQSIGVLLVEHDIDRVFELADRVTVMNQGAVLVDGTVDDVRGDARVREVYIGSGTAAIAARALQGERHAGDALLSVRAVDAFYGKSHILHGVSLDLRAGSVLAVLGRNGAGKSTLLKALTGIVRPHGEVTLGGRAIAGLAPEEIARLGVGFVPQGRRLFPGLSVRDNLMLGRLKRGGGGAWTDEKIFSFFPRIRERLDVAADYLSGGEQQMVAIARALAGDMRLLLLDEPFEGLSPAITEEVFAAIDRLRREVAILIVDHHLDLVLALADEAVVLDRGAVAHRGPARPLHDDLELRRKVLWL
jgi:ABC-type branched-subunit amino acid transport system ATPase component/ABC-type branched-subunit amino acid transport system permease subunit